MKKVRSSQTFISVKSCTELNKTHFFPVGIVKNSLYKAVWWIPKFIAKTYEKYLFLEFNTITKVLLLRMRYIIDGVVCLIIDT